MAVPEFRNGSRPEGDDGIDDDEEIDETGYKTIKDAVLFAIDVSSSMLTPTQPTKGKSQGNDSATLAALKCAYQLMQQRIISNPNDMMGILLFGTEESKFGNHQKPKDPPAYPHCYLLTDLDVPAAADVKMLRNLVQDEKESSKLLVPSKEAVSMANVLFCANQIFTTKAANFSSRRLFLVTDEDDPHSNNKTLASGAAVRAKDLFDLGVIIELFPISHPDKKEFDKSIFYDDIVYRGLPSDPDAPAPVSTVTKTSSTGDGISLLQSLLSSINSKAVPRRALFSLPFEIGPGLKIGVKGYILVKRQTVVKSCYVWVGGEKVQIAVGSTSTIAEDTARTVDKSEIRRAYNFGGERITFTEDETKALYYFGDPTIRIIGFKPVKLLPVWATHKPPVFIYPSDTDYIGSTRVFSSLQQKLLASEKFALVWFIARRNAKPVLAALIPGAEKIDDMGEQSMPPGLWAIPLPFADDIRSDPEADFIRAPDELVEVMKPVIQQLQLPKSAYDPDRYPNPSLQWFYRILQALALEEDIPENPEDKTIPRHRQIHKRAGPYVIEWGKELDLRYKEWELGEGKSESIPNRTAIKRSAGDDGSLTTTTTTKKQKTTDELDDSDMKIHYKNGTLAKLTVAMLKEWAQKKRLPVVGKKKPELVSLVEEFFDRI